MDTLNQIFVFISYLLLQVLPCDGGCYYSYFYYNYYCYYSYTFNPGMIGGIVVGCIVAIVIIVVVCIICNKHFEKKPRNRTIVHPTVTTVVGHVQPMPNQPVPPPHYNPQGMTYPPPPGQYPHPQLGSTYPPQQQAFGYGPPQGSYGGYGTNPAGGYGVPPPAYCQ